MLKNKIIEPIEATLKNLQSVVALNAIFLDSFPPTRKGLLAKLANLSRTFYHTSIVKFLRMSSVATDTFGEEFNRAYWRGTNERKRLISKIEDDLTKCREYLEKSENLRRYRGVLEGIFNKGENPQIIIQERVKELLEVVNDPDEKLKIKKLENISLKFLKNANEAIKRNKLLYVDFIEPLIDCYQSEIDGIQKILDTLEFPQRKEADLTDLARTADILSWGLQDFDMDIHLKTGNNELKLLKESSVPLLEKEYKRLKTFN